MQHVSTRGAARPLDFRGATLAGLASDGGLYVPAEWPRWTPGQFRALRDASYAETAIAVLSPFVGDALTAGELRALVEAAYGSFAHAAVTPLVQLDHRHWLLELHHGPTLAFKDLALQLLGRLFAHFLAGETVPLTIIGATSGDTGSAAIAAVAGLPGMRIVMLHPEGRVSDVQRRQMTTVDVGNVHNVAIAGSFDDAQAIVKALFNDPGFRARHRLAAVNSINWARLAAQVVYYVFAAVRLGAPDAPVAFSVPTGNFGDIFAGYVASRMGLPVSALILATNENDILARALGKGDYSRRPLTATASPSMDIQVSSNFERLLFDLHGRDSDALAAAMAGFEATGRMVLPEPVRAEAATLFRAVRVTGAQMAATLAWAHAASGQLLDPHTGIGLAAARRLEASIEGPIVTLATAHPAKFPAAVEAATGIFPMLPPRAAGLFDRAEHFSRLPAETGAVRAFIDGLGA
ncbi:threonine synthase [Thermaurantiacus sp.]